MWHRLPRQVTYSTDQAYLLQDIVLRVRHVPTAMTPPLSPFVRLSFRKAPVLQVNPAISHTILRPSVYPRVCISYAEIARILPAATHMSALVHLLPFAKTLQILGIARRVLIVAIAICLNAQTMLTQEHAGRSAVACHMLTVRDRYEDRRRNPPVQRPQLTAL